MLSFLGFLMGSALLVGLCNWMALRPWRRAQDAHWTERARLLHPARMSHGHLQWFLPGTAALAVLWSGTRLSPVGAAVGTFCGSLLAASVIDRTVFPAWTWGSWFGFALSQIFQRAVGWALLIGGMVLMPVPLDGRAGWVVAGYLACSLVLAGGFANVLWRRSYYVHPASSRLATIVADVASQTRVRVRATWELSIPTEYAAAFVVTRELAFSRTLLEHSDDDAIRSICLHEVGHLMESRWITIVRMAVGPVASLPYLFILPVLASPFPPNVVWLWLASHWINRAYRLLSVRWEKAADRFAVSQSPDPATYARALEGLHRWNQIPVVLPKAGGQTHPDHYDRMIAAGITPDYPRPEPAAAHTAIGLLVQVAFVVALVTYLLWRIPR